MAAPLHLVPMALDDPAPPVSNVPDHLVLDHPAPLVSVTIHWYLC